MCSISAMCLVQGGCQEVVWRRAGRGLHVSEAWGFRRMTLFMPQGNCLPVLPPTQRFDVIYKHGQCSALWGPTTVYDTVVPQCLRKRSPVTSSLHVTDQHEWSWQPSPSPESNGLLWVLSLCPGDRSESSWVLFCRITSPFSLSLIPLCTHLETPQQTVSFPKTLLLPCWSYLWQLFSLFPWLFPWLFIHCDPTHLQI